MCGVSLGKVVSTGWGLAGTQVSTRERLFLSVPRAHQRGATTKSCDRALQSHSIHLAQIGPAAEVRLIWD